MPKKGGKEMFKIEGDTIHLTRGDRCEFDFEDDYGYVFQAGDKVKFSVYEEEGLENPPVLSKEFEVTEETPVVTISLTSQETKFGPMKSEEISYWYEVEKIGDETALGYDENGAKILILYPEGADENAKS